jgi:2,3-diketo-5-methylthiopentyl-1-phosphate enolase
MDQSLFALTDDNLDGDRILATYSLTAPFAANPLELAQRFAIGQTVGTWLEVPGTTAAMRRRHGGRIVQLIELPPGELSEDRRPGGGHGGGPGGGPSRKLLLTVAFPWENFGTSLTMLLTTVLGMDASTAIRAKLVDLILPRSYVSRFPGPAFGLEGVREVLKRPEGPLILNMIKPCLGFDPAVGAGLFREAAAGGADLVKDDELLGDPAHCPLKERLAAYLAGPGGPYCPNITAPWPRLRENAALARDAGAKAVMVNFVFAGLDALKSLAEADIGLPVMVHYAGAGSMFESARSGLSSTILLGKLPRLAGADLIHLPSPFGPYPLKPERAVLAAAAQRAPWGGLKAAVPVIGGGVVPGMVPAILKALGPDIMLAVGGAVQGHPGGPSGGVAALRAAIEASLAGEDLEMAAEHSEPLRKALTLWGPGAA